MNLQAILRWSSHHLRQIALAVLLGLVGYWVLRGCVPALGGRHLPASVEDQLRGRYTSCVTDTAIWPGEPRQPECGTVTITGVSEGVIPETDTKVERALCFKLSYTNPYWTTQGTTRHEIVDHGRQVSKVALLQAGVWQVGPDNDDADQALWSRYRCHGTYENQALQP